jgi:hypothetical protein
VFGLKAFNLAQSNHPSNMFLYYSVIRTQEDIYPETDDELILSEDEEELK